MLLGWIGFLLGTLKNNFLFGYCLPVLSNQLKICLQLIYYVCSNCWIIDSDIFMFDEMRHYQKVTDMPVQKQMYIFVLLQDCCNA